MSNISHEEERPEVLDKIIAEIISDADDIDNQLRAFQKYFRDHVVLQADGFVIGEPVSVMSVDYIGNVYRGLTAKCRREDGSDYVVAIPEIRFPAGTESSRLVAAYRKWLNLEPYPSEMKGNPSQERAIDSAEGDSDPLMPVELVVLSVKGQTARCRFLESTRSIILRASGLWNVVPGAIITVKRGKQWIFGGNQYLTGKILSVRIDVKSLNLLPLELHDRGIWHPIEQYWGEEGEPYPEWVQQIIARGPRMSFEMEQVIPGEDPDDIFNDPILESSELKYAGYYEEATNMLMEVCRADLRCLDAHSHLGMMFFHQRPQKAILHYEVGLRIGELTLGENFDGVLEWGYINNRPFMRCLHGYGLCLWRLGRFSEAESVFNRMLWLNPGDNQGVRFIIDDVKANIAWSNHEDF